MNSVLADVIDKTCPKFNKNVTDGTAKQILKTIPEYLDDIIKSSLRSLNPKIPLTYEGYRRMTPMEEYKFSLVSDNNKTTYDLAESNIYLTEYVFNFNGERISRPLYLPYAQDGNIIRVSNTQYHIIPVLSDTVISPSHDEVFVRLLKDKLTFRSQVRNFILNGERVPGKIVHTNIVKTNTMNIKDNIGRPLTPVSLYLLSKYGFRKCMERYSGIKDYVVTNGSVDDLRNDYNVFESTKLKPRSLKETVYVGHDVKICIPKKHKITHYLENFIYGMIYALDILPNDGEDFIKVYMSENIRQETLFWRIMLGRIVYKNTFSVDRIIEDMMDHMDNLNGYLDNLIKTKLEENGIIVNNFFDLLAVILENYNTWLIKSKEYNSDIRNRYIDILYYIMYDIIVGFNKVILALNKRVGKKATLSQREVLKILSNELSTKKIFSICRSSAQSLALLTVDSSLDFKYPKITVILED